MQISLKHDIAQAFPRERGFATCSWLFNDITLVFLGSVMSMMVNSFVSLVVLAVIFLKHFFVGEISRCLYEYSFITAILVFIGVIDYVLLGEGGVIAVVRDFVLLATSLCIGLALGREKDEAYIKTGLLGIRNLVVLACLVSLVMEVCMQTTFDVLVAHTPFQTAPIYMDILSWRCRSFLGHPIVFAHMLLTAAAISYFLETSQMMKWGTIALFSVFIFLTRSRSAWLIYGCFICFALIYLLSSRKIKHWNYVVLAFPFVVALAAFLFSTDFIPLIIRRFSELSVDSSYSQRSGAISYMLNYWASSPLTWLFGNGDNASSAAMSETTISIENFTVVDNGWVSLLFNFGILGVVGILLLAVQPVLSHKSGRGDDLWRCIFFGFSVTFILEMCFYEPYGWFVPFSLFLLLSGVAFTMRLKNVSR